jgi:hypothetical protein
MSDFSDKFHHEQIDAIAEGMGWDQSLVVKFLPYMKSEVTEAMQSSITALETENTRLTTDLSCARAAMAKEAATKCNELGVDEERNFGLVRGTQNYYRARDAILALADAPLGYVCVKVGDTPAIESLLMQAAQIKGDNVLGKATP